MDAIRLCPHCAHKRCEVVEVSDQPGEAFAVICEECLSRGPIDLTEVGAVINWNLRAGHESSTHAMFEQIQ